MEPVESKSVLVRTPDQRDPVTPGTPHLKSSVRTCLDYRSSPRLPATERAGVRPADKLDKSAASETLQYIQRAGNDIDGATAYCSYVEIAASIEIQQFNIRGIRSMSSRRAHQLQYPPDTLIG